MFQWCVILRQFHINNAIYFMRRMVTLLMPKSWIEDLISKRISQNDCGRVFCGR
jgi:hypothetical protein